jgi:hypothetical protein
MTESHAQVRGAAEKSSSDPTAILVQYSARTGLSGAHAPAARRIEDPPSPRSHPLRSRQSRQGHLTDIGPFARRSPQESWLESWVPHQVQKVNAVLGLGRTWDLRHSALACLNSVGHRGRIVDMEATRAGWASDSHETVRADRRHARCIPRHAWTSGGVSCGHSVTISPVRGDQPVRYGW